MDDTRVTIIPNLLVEHGRLDRTLAGGRSIAEVMRDHGWNPAETHARVTIDGKLVSQAEWEYQLPYSHKCIVIRRVPMGGGGGGGKNAGMMIGMLAVMALAIAAPYLAPAAWGLVTAAGGLSLTGSLLSAGIGIGGMLAMRALIPPPLPRRLTKEIAYEKSVSISVSPRRHHHARRMSRHDAGADRRAGYRRRAQLAS